MPLKLFLTPDSESTEWNLPRKLKRIRNCRLTKKIFVIIESPRTEETRIYQKYGKLGNAIIWLPGDLMSQDILKTCRSTGMQNLELF